MHSDHITRLTLEGWDINAGAIDLNVTVVHELTCSGTGITQSETVTNVVETKLKDLKKKVTGFCCST